MDFDLQWLLIGLPVAFALGWLASRFDLRQVQARTAATRRKAYFKGLNLLLNEQHDKAIDAFIEAVQNDPDTTELHFAPGQPVPPPRRIRARGARAPAPAASAPT